MHQQIFFQLIEMNSLHCCSIIQEVAIQIFMQKIQIIIFEIASDHSCCHYRFRFSKFLALHMCIYVSV